MVNTYTEKLGLAKPANGDIDWHIPINGNWDDIDSKLGPLYEDITSSATDLTFNKDIVVENITLSKIKSSLWNMIADFTKKSTCYESLDAVSTTSLSWETLKTATSVPVDRNGTVYVCYTVNAITSEDYSASASAYGQVLKNGEVITESVSSITSYHNYNNQSVTTEIIVEVVSGDVITVQAYVTHTGVSGTAYISDFGVYAHLQPIIDATVAW